MTTRTMLGTVMFMATLAGAAAAQQYGYGYSQQNGYGQQYSYSQQQPYGQQPYGGNGQYGPPPQRYGQGPGWEGAAPPEFAEAQRRGYRDGVDGARKDFENHRPPNVNNRDEFRNPHFIPRPDRRDYKFGFRRGYDEAVRHIYGGRGPRY